jgi:arylsulfatase A-like enzyme
VHGRGGERSALLILLIVVAIGGCRAVDDDLRGVVLISVDTLRPDHLGLYGYARPTSPTLDLLARDGTVFETASSVSPWTLPAHATLLTGLYPHRHGVLATSRRLDSEIPTLASRFEEAGFRTGAIVNSIYLGERFGLDRGFGSFELVPPPGRSASDVASRALAWLDRNAAETAPFFLFLHFYDVHSDYRSIEPIEALFTSDYAGHADGSTAQLLRATRGEVRFDESDRRRLVDLYDAGIRQLDGELGRVVDWLDGRGILERVLLIVTSDHGEEFLEHGGVLHARTHYDEVIRIPLIVRGPGVPRGERVRHAASISDVAPTLLARAGLASTGMDGRDLTSFWNRRAPLPSDFVYADGGRGNRRAVATQSIRGPRHKLIYDRGSEHSELYDLVDDPGEHHDLAESLPELRDELLGRLREFTALSPGTAPDASALTDDETQQLRALGYAP